MPRHATEGYVDDGLVSRDALLANHEGRLDTFEATDFVTDHSELTGLTTGDPHTQYLTPVRGDERYYTLSGPELATAEDLDAHINDNSAAHAATAVSASPSGLVIVTGFTTVQGAIAAADAVLADHESRLDTLEGLRPSLLDTQTGTVNLGAGSTVTDGVSVELTIPADTVHAGDLLRATAWGNFRNGSGSNVNLTQKVKLGATAAVDTGAIAFSSGSGRRKWRAVIEILVPTLVTQNVALLNSMSDQTTATAVTGIGTQTVGSNNTVAENLALEKVLQLLITLGSAGATIEWVTVGATLELVTA